MKRFFNSFYLNTGLIKDAGQRSVASRVSALTIEGAVLFSVLGTFGMDLTPLITAAGVTGATLGFACKDFGANFVASIALSGHSSLREGSRVTIGTGTAAVSGTVCDWDTRYLYLRNDKKELVSVPNNLILNSVLFCENPAPAGAAPTAAKIQSSPFKGKEDPLSAKEWKASASAADAGTPPKK